MRAEEGAAQQSSSWLNAGGSIDGPAGWPAPSTNWLHRVPVTIAASGQVAVRYPTRAGLRKRDFHYRRAAEFGFAAAFCSSLGQTFFIGQFGRDVQADLALSETEWAGWYGAATRANGLLMFWLGGVADTLPVRRAIAASLSVLAAGAALFAASRSAWLLLAALFLPRLGGQGLTGHLAIVVATRFAQQRGRSVATAALGFILGEALLPAVVVAALGLVDWRWVWAGAAALAMLVAAPALVMLAGALPGAGTRDDEGAARWRPADESSFPRGALGPARVAPHSRRPPQTAVSAPAEQASPRRHQRLPYGLPQVISGARQNRGMPVSLPAAGR